MEIIKKYLEIKLKLSINANKIIVRKVRSGSDFCGYVILPHHHILRTKTKKRMLFKLQKKLDNLRSGLIEPEEFEQSLNSYLGLLKYCHSYNIRQKIKKLIDVTLDQDF